MDGSRPSLAARRLLRILSTQSARRTLRPFYRGLFQELLAREREEYRGKPARSLLLVQTILGRRQMLAVLRRSYRETTERNFVLRFRQDGESSLYVAKRLPPPKRPPEPEEAHRPREEPQTPAPPPAGGLSLSEAEFQTLVRGVAGILSRQSRLDALRRGGM